MDINKEVVSLKQKDIIQEDKLETIELKKDEYSTLLKAQTQVDIVTSDNEDLRNKFKAFKKENEEIKAESEKIKKEMETFKAEKKQSLKKEGENYINDKVNKGFIKPAHKDRYVEEYISYKSDEKKFADWKDDIESRGKVISFTPSGNVKNSGENFKYDPEKLDFKAGATINYDELNEKIEAYSKAKNVDFKTACAELGVANPSEFGEEKEV